MNNDYPEPSFAMKVVTSVTVIILGFVAFASLWASVDYYDARQKKVKDKYQKLIQEFQQENRVAILPNTLIPNHNLHTIKKMKVGDTFYFEKYVMDVNKKGECWLTLGGESYNAYAGSITANEDSNLMVEKKADGYHVTIIGNKTKWNKQTFLSYKNYVPVRSLFVEDNIPLKDILE